MNRRILLNLNIAKPKPKVKKKAETNKQISRLCLATIIKDEDGTFKAKVSLLNNECNSDILAIPLTEQSLRLRGKTHVFYNKDLGLNKPTLIIRDEINCTTSPGTKKQYSTLIEGCVIAGYVVNINNKFYFDYKQLVKYNENMSSINPVKIDDSKPLF